ncbi:MAG: 50S ribosomal protein L20 [Deltaproteobacteria bacterium]|nr:50S ribosomal protein L20 [Deltaproteobacteria bacterium]
MARAKRGFKARRRRNKILKRAKGFRGGQGRLIRTASEKVKRALAYATRDRKVRKRDFRSLWITRIGAAAREHGFSYSQLMGRLKKANVALDRKMLSDLAIGDPAGFARVVEIAKAA